MNDLVAYIQTLGNNRKVDKFVEPPEEYLPSTWTGQNLAKNNHVDTSSDAAANAGRGIFTQNCTACHGLNGEGNGPNSITLLKKPANFTRPFFKQYTDQMWYYRVAEGVPGTRMPRFGLTLTQEEIWYLVAYLKTLPQEHAVVTDSVDKVNKVDHIKLPKLTNQLYEPHHGGHE